MRKLNHYRYSIGEKNRGVEFIFAIEALTLERAKEIGDSYIRHLQEKLKLPTQVPTNQGLECVYYYELHFNIDEAKCVPMFTTTEGKELYLNCEKRQ